MAHEIKILVTDETKTNDNLGTTTPQQASQDLSKPTDEGVANASKSKATMAAMMVGQQTLSYMTSNIGKWTGSKHTQTQINNASELIGLGIAFYVNPFVGAAMTAIKVGTTMADNFYEDRWEKISSDVKKKKAGELTGKRH